MDDLLNRAPCGFLSFTDDGHVVEANATLLEMLGYEAGELLGRHVESLMPVASRIFYQTHLFPLLKLHDRVEEVYFSLRMKGGAEIPVLVNAARRERGGLAVNDCVLMHMRQRNQYEDEILHAKRAAEEAARAKDEFLATVSHELRTPLTAILGWARMLQGGTLDERMAARAVDAIERNAASQNQLIGDLLDFSRIISGRMRLDVGRVELASVIEAAMDVVGPAAEAKGIRLQTTLDPKAGPVSGDYERLQQVMWNLLSNAVKFTPKGGRVQVRLARVNSSVEISVSDTGQGIAPEFLPYVFDRFRQADQTTTRRQAGLGLGMSITRHLVELHGGTIRAESPGEGQGTTFVVKLPVMIVHNAKQVPEADAGRRPPRQDHSRPAEMARLDGVHVLVVDDERDARELLTTILTQSGAVVTAASGVAEALDKLRQVEPDLLVSDIEMANEDGYSMIRKARVLEEGRGRRIPAIALTAHARSSDRLRALSEGYQMHIPKPVEPAELVLAIANLTHKGRE
ncbi:MAG TPA: ATP-binding protein [Pyrinomonadaceae bacterium]|nr:ATP-binding protein [Pyrinomonadaceae bacterium]